MSDDPIVAELERIAEDAERDRLLRDMIRARAEDLLEAFNTYAVRTASGR